MNASELIDEIRWNITQNGGVPSGIIHLTGLYEIVTMEMNITVLCVPGFTGMMCEEDIDDCVTVSCSGNGQCVDGVDSFICMCDPGFTGELCQINIDDCVGVNCSGNGECVDEVNNFKCKCNPGYRGQLCEEGIATCY